MATNVEINRSAQKAAILLRRQYNIANDIPLCIYDIAAKVGVEVKFCAQYSLEGMYIKQNPPVVLISAFRPVGRQAFTCAHELGHHIFGHGTRIDEYCESEDSIRAPEERLADTFSAFFLMPINAVRKILESRNWDLNSCTPRQVYELSGYFGVSYEAFIIHSQLMLKLISFPKSKELLKHSPKNIRGEIFPDKECSDLYIIHKDWVSRPIDANVGDLILLPPSSKVIGENTSILKDSNVNVILIGSKPGSCLVTNGNWNAQIRISRKNFVGRSIFRNLEEDDAN